MFDNDEAGVAGAKDALWHFAEKGLHVHLIWSPNLFEGEFDRKQPETVNYKDWEKLIAHAS